MKKTVSLVLVLILAILLVACGGSAKSAEEVNKILTAEGWDSYVMPANELDMGSFKAKEGLFASKGMNMISYIIFEKSSDIDAFKKDTPEMFGMKIKQKGNAVVVFLGMSEEDIKTISGKIGF